VRLVRGEVERLTGLQHNVVEYVGTEDADIARILQKRAQHEVPLSVAFVGDRVFSAYLGVQANDKLAQRVSGVLLWRGSGTVASKI